jgi:DNA end-binding protein Ku
MATSVWKGYISFGLVSFPVRLFAAAREETVRFHMLHKKDLSRIKEVWYCAEEDKPVEKEHIVKGYEYEKGKYVVVEQEELKKVAPPTARVMEILQFVETSEVDPIVFDKSYYAQPDEAVSKPYSLLLHAMRETKQYAIAKVAMHNREHVVIIRPSSTGMVIHTMYYEHELHTSNQPSLPKQERYSAKEIELAKRLIETLSAPFKLEEYHDSYRENVMKLIEQKRKGEKVTPIRQPRVAPVVDLMAALQASLNKSTHGSGATTKKARKKVAGRKTAAKKRRRAA